MRLRPRGLDNQAQASTSGVMLRGFLFYVPVKIRRCSIPANRHPIREDRASFRQRLTQGNSLQNQPACSTIVPAPIVGQTANRVMGRWPAKHTL